MAERSPGDHDDHGGSNTDSGSSNNQPSSLPMTEDHFGGTTSHPLAETYQFTNGLQFRIRNSPEKKCPSFTYATLPGVKPTPIEWKMCCDPDSDVGSEHVTYHTLTDKDDKLSTVVEYHIESNIVGLIIINNTNSTTLSNDFTSRYVAPSTPIPLYIVSSRDGEQLRALVKAYNEGSVQIKVLVESAVDSVPGPVVPSGPPHPTLSNKPDSQSKLDSAVSYSLYEELKKILHVHRKERIHACASQSEFQFVFSCFHNYEAQAKRESPDKAIRMLDNFTDDTFNKDFLFYLLLGYRFIVHSDKYFSSNNTAINSYLFKCIEKFEAITDVQAMANVILTFIQGGDFTVQFVHGSKCVVSVFQLLYHMTSVMLGRSNKIHENVKTVYNAVYRKILWISLFIYFGLQDKVQSSKLASLWESELFEIQRELAFSTEVVKEFAKGFELMKALQLPESVYFDYSGLGIFLNPLQIRMLHISHIMNLVKIGQHYLNWGLTFLCHFLPPLRCNYDHLFAMVKRDWRRYSEDGTKICLYREALKFLEYIFERLPMLKKTEEDSKKVDVIEIEIKKWIELLVNNIDMSANDAVQYFKELRSDGALGKKHNRTVTASIRAKGMDIVTQLSMPQFFTLFIDSQIWTFEFVEKFLINYTVPMSIDLKDPSWKVLLEEIVSRFSDAHCKKCIVGLIERIGKAYKSGKKQDKFIVDLIKLDTPNLLLVQSHDDLDVDQMFIEVIRIFIQKNALREVILNQVPAIMKLVKLGNHLHSLILAVLQKEIAPDSKMIEKFNSSNQLKLVLNASINAASASLTALSQLSEVDKFYWHFIASCCNHVQPNAENLSKLKTYLFVTERLSNIFLDYYASRKIEKPPVIHEVPQEIIRISNPDVKDYFKWVIKMQNIMIHWQFKFMEQEFNYDDIFTYDDNLKHINTFAKAVYTEHLVYTDSDIAKIKERYSVIYAELSSLLVMSNKEYGWCTLVDILNSYGIKLSHTLQTKLDTHLVLPGSGAAVTPDDVQQRLNQPNGQLELEPEMILMLKKSMTWEILQEIFNDLQSFLEPIISQLDFLVYFHLHHSEMFSKHLKSQIVKLSASSEQPIDTSAIMFTIPSMVGTQSSSDPDEKLLQFATALENTRAFILSLIKGTAKYAEIFAEGSMEESIQKFDAESEFRIMCGFPKFQEESVANEEGKEGIKHMLELFQYSQQISVIPDVCAQYHLEKCLNDPKLQELRDIVNSVSTAEDRAKVTGQIANNHMKKIWQVLNFADTSIAKKCLKIFPAVANCAEFYQFIQKKGFANDRTAFSSQVELITAQLQHEDYNETVLNHLMPAFQYITPFLDKEQSLGELMNKIIKLFRDGVGFGHDSRKDFCQLETVNSNITMIQIWFSRTEVRVYAKLNVNLTNGPFHGAVDHFPEYITMQFSALYVWSQGDTLENVSTDLDSIMATGYFKLVIKPKRVIGTSKMDYEAMAEQNSEVLLHYEPTMTSFLHRRRVQTMSESFDETSLSVMTSPSAAAALQRQFSSVAETWNNEQIDDFVRKLGFLEAQSEDVEQKVKIFQQLNQTAQKFYRILLKLRDLGHPEYVEITETIVCSDKLHSVESAELKVANAEEKLKNWNTTIRNMHNTYDKLLFFSVSKVLSLYDILTTFSIEEMIQEVGFLFENDPKAIKKLKTAVKNAASAVENTLSFSKETPVAHVGKYLAKLCGDISVAEHFLYSRSQPNTSVKGKSLLSFQEVVHFAPHYNNKQLLRLLIQIYNGVPESYEVFQCDENSIEEDLKLFLSRASKFRYRTFTILGVNLLPYKLQEVILQHHSQETDQTMESAVRLNYIETAGSILHEMPWVVVKEYKENGPDLKWDDAKHVCRKYVNKGTVNFELILVYGHAGDGKTHYIKRHLHESHSYLVIAVNESFSPLSAILKLRSLPRNESCSIFFNFTIVPSTICTVPEEQMKYKKLMNTLAWFFFKLLVFEYVEDSETGMAFRLPGGHQWKIFIEVPSLSEVAPENAGQHLEWICNEIPIFGLLGNSVLIEKEKPYDIDSSVQLVCKYLRAYKNRADRRRGINRLFIDNSPPVKFGDDPNLPDEECHYLLKEYMPDHVTKNKVLQQLFIKYMERRCRFMESFPGFCYNSGCGTLFNHTQVSAHDLNKMVSDRILVKLQGRYYSNTSQLGQVLMETMLSEVSEFCKINIQQSWAIQAHQQLIYEVKGGAGTIQLLTLKPEELNEEITKKFEVLGIDIPDMKQLRGREKLDGYLSSALGVPLKDGRLQDIDEAKYVLTLDYTVKMLNIHERRECGIPVIIEGETGVGKTALINMLSKLWNHALISEWRALKGRIIEMLYHKSLDNDNSDLQYTLQKLITDWQCDKGMENTERVLSEEELIPLTEMSHPMPGGDIIPFHQYINRRLLEFVNSESILGLLDVDDVETKSDQYRDRLFSFSSRETSAVSNLIDITMKTPSPQATAKLLSTLLNGNLIPTFYKLNIHAALSPKKIQEFFIPIVKLAKHLLKVHKTKQVKGMDEPPVVTVFLDEVNTSSCMGLFKEIIIDKTFEGELLPPNIFLVAACNPHRGNSLAVHESKEEHKAETWVRGSYYVQKLHPTLRFLMWDYGSLNAEQEAAYVQSKMIMVNDDLHIVQNVVFSELVVKCQNLIRQFAYKQLTNFGIEDGEAKLRSTSCVSQRDIQRVFTFYGWIIKTYEMLQAPFNPEGVLTATMTMGDVPAACITKHPMIKERISVEEMRQRALLVALGLVYYMRLDSDYRRMFTEELDKMHFSVKFLTAFKEEMDFYTDELSLPTGIAKTEALKENLFATIICTVTETPLIIVGAPGSSKTLSFNLTISNLKGPESKQKLFRNTDVFKSLDPHYYQCSRRTTSTEIETVFQRAINRQRSHKSFSMPVRCVVFMDEAGLPEESHESLKVLHYHLDQQEVAFVAITNHILDAAKTNRAVSLFRPTASQDDLETLAKGCLCANPEKPPPELEGDLKTIVKFCPAYYAIMKDKRFEKFFGLRDFIHFINYIRRERKVDITPQLVLQSLERNFNGTTKGFEHICSTFLEKVGAKVDELKQRSIIEILRSSLADKPYHQQLSRTPSKVMSPQTSHDDTQNEVRYKLIIDPSEDESITRLLFMFDILRHEHTRTYICSDFLGDGQLQKINTIAAIRHSAIAGHTVIMSQTDDIHESFYDLFNQHFRRIDDPEAGPRYFTNIAIGAHLKPSRVDQKFQCIVVVKESEIKNTPAPFLNRFEKYYISHTNLLNLVLNALRPCLKVITNDVYKKVEAFYSLLGQGSFYGGNKETVCSLLLSILPRPTHKYKPITQSIASNTEVCDGEFSSFAVVTKASSNKVSLLQNVVNSLQEFGGFCHMENSMEELEHDANCIIDLLAKAGSEFSGVAETLESCDDVKISQWITEAMDLIYTGDAPPDIDIADYDTCDDDIGDVKTLGASDGACMVTAVIAQWLVRHMCKKLMQLLTPEAAILKRKSIPTSYLETYLNYQTHFSIKDLIKTQSELLNQCGNGKVATKLICYTRSTPSIHQLPAMYPRSLSSVEQLQQSNNLVEDLICDKADNLFLCKLSSISSQTAFKLQLQAFQASQQQTVFVLIVNMQDTSRLIINHIRIMIEEAEHTKTETKKLFILLLHFPAMMFYDPCYPSLFLYGWDHYYLDAIDRANKSSLVDTKEWFRLSCLTIKEVSSPTATDESMLQSLLSLLSKHESILVIASRILLNIDSNTVSLESLPNIVTKANYLKKLLFDKKVAKILCLKFKSYWKPSIMGDHLEQAARFSKSRESTLNVSDSVDSIYRSSFFNFIAYMIYQISRSHNLDMLLDDSCDKVTLDLFLELLDVYPIPKLSEIKVFNNTWDCRIHTAGRSGYIPQFPFFMEVSSHICDMVEQSLAEINKSDDIFQERGSTDAVDIQSKEQMLKKLYEHLCDKISAIMKADKTIGEKFMSAIAIKGMGNELIWQKYFNDFTHHYLHLSATAPDSLEHKLVQLTFSDVLRSYNVMKAIAVHCYMHLYQLDLAKVIASLKPLGQLELLKVDKQSLYPGDPEYSLVATLQTSKTALGSSSICKFVIDSLFAVLVNAIYSRDKDSRSSLLHKWFSSYRDMMSVVSIKNMLPVAMLIERLKTQYHLMEMTFLILLSFHQITDVAAECAYTLACHLCTKCFDDKFQFKGDVTLNLKQIVLSFHMMLQSPQFAAIVQMPQLYQHIMEGLFTHFFPDTANPSAVYSKEDIEFFLTFANEQEIICQDDGNLMSLSKFKFHLDRILCKGWSKNGAFAKPLTFYKLEICTCVGETILSRCPEVSLNEYTPLYLSKATMDNQQMLIHLYFYTVLERLQTCQFSPTHLVKIVTDTEKKLTEVTNNAEKLIAVVERQAMLEALLQAIVNNLDLDDKSKLSNLSTISDQINNLVKDQSHRDILLMHLMKRYHGPHGVLNLLAEKHRKFWEPLHCLKLIKEELKGSPPSTSHQFPFIVGSPTAEHQFGNIYREICNLLNGIEETSLSTAEKAKDVLKSIVNTGDTSYDGKSTVRMMIWLCVYYEFYCKKKQSTVLIKFFKEMDKDLGLSKERLNILNCFLDPKKMNKAEEAPNPLNPNAEVLEYTKEGKIRPKRPPSNVPKRDAIWEFFNPRHAREDTSDVELRHAVANMIAVVFGLPSRSTHLWYHMFNPGDLENSYLTGFMYSKVVKRGALMYDCGCELNEDGNYGRPDYNYRDSFSLHSWYLLLWCNYGAFCVGLLTQPTVLEQLKGHILSDWMSIRDYCMTQLRTIWFHVRSNMSFGDEERSFFIMSSMYRLFMLFQEDAFPHPQGKFIEFSGLVDYEKAWHKLVYEFSKTDLKNKLESHSSHSVWALPILKNYRLLEQHYPHPATENDYMKSVVDATEANNCSYTHLFALQQFTLEQKRLQVGGALLPDLVEFYKWIHTQLSHLITYQRAKQISIGNVISLTAKRYSQQLCDHLNKLFKRIISKYNEYLKMSGGVVGNATCNRAAKPTDVHYISKDTPLIHLVSLEDANKNDWLYIVLMDVIENHNAFLNSIFTHAIPSDCHYKKYLPDNPVELHPTEVSSQACIVPSDEGSGGRLFLKLINSHYIYNGRQSSAVFDLERLEQDVIKFFIAGKPLITIDGSIRTVFRFRNSPTENTLPGNNPGCAIDLSAIAQELPNHYKEPLGNEMKKALEFHFRTASYHTFTEIVDGLRTVMGHLIQDILQRKDKASDPKNTKLFDYLTKFFSKDHRVFDEIGIQSINDTQRKHLGDIEMKRLFKCLGLFVGWLQGGLYDFNSLPIPFFKHLDKEDLDIIMKTNLKYSSTGMDRLLTELDEFEKSLNHAENHLITAVEHKSSIVQCLVDLGLCDLTDKFVSVIPKSVLVCHYVHFRMTLRKLKIKVTTTTHSQAQNSMVEDKWTEIIEDLWKHLPHFQDVEELYDDHCLKFDCVTLQFGHGEESDSDSETWVHQNTSDMEDSYEEVTKKEELIQRIKDDPELQKAVMETLAPVPTPSSASVSIITPSISPSSVGALSDKAMGMTTEELCQWLKDIKVDVKYIEFFREENVDGSELATYDDSDLQELGISEQRIRKKIMVQFRKIT